MHRLLTLYWPQEAVHINLGLLSLRTCITALVEGDAHVPYGNAKLTQLLSSALGGNCRSLVLVTGSMERRCMERTQAGQEHGAQVPAAQCLPP
jgi:hypothetical protein